ncbi:MAG: mechanosensitive ion channel family protein [Acidimicrobiales bacterium]
MEYHPYGPPPPGYRPWITGISAGVLTLAAIVGGYDFGRFRHAARYSTVVGWGAALIILTAGTIAVRHLATGLNRAFNRRGNPGAGGAVRLVVTGIGLVVLLFAALAVLGASLAHLLIGAGLAGVILGIAAQQSLSNLFASIVLLLARPFSVGDHIRIRSGVVGVLDVTVLASGLTYVTVRTEDGILQVPNSILLNSGIGHLHPTPPDSTPPGPSATPTPSASATTTPAATDPEPTPPPDATS